MLGELISQTRVSNSLTSVLPEILDSGRLRQINSGQAESGQADSGKLRQIISGQAESSQANATQAESSQANATQAATVGRGRDIRARPRLSRHRAIPLPRVLDRPSRCISPPPMRPIITHFSKSSTQADSGKRTITRCGYTPPRLDLVVVRASETDSISCCHLCSRNKLMGSDGQLSQKIAFKISKNGNREPNGPNETDFYRRNNGGFPNSYLR